MLRQNILPRFLKSSCSIRYHHRFSYSTSQKPPLAYSRAQFSTSASNLFVTTSRRNVSEVIKMEAKASNENFKLENLFNVKGKGMFRVRHFPRYDPDANRNQLPSSPEEDRALV